MSDGTLFYSKVRDNVQNELRHRAQAGKASKTTKDINFMVGKVANVDVIAFKDTWDSEKIHAMGGKLVTNNEGGRFLPGGMGGYLNTISKRPSPYIEEASIEFLNPSDDFGLMNTATIKIVIPDIQRDLDTIEDIYFRLSRKLLIRIVHPEEALLGGNSDIGLSEEETEENVTKLRNIYPGLKLSQFNKLNEVGFRGIVSEFSYEYTEDASIIATVKCQGFTGIYGEASLLMGGVNKNKEYLSMENNESKNNFYTVLRDGINKKINKYLKDNDLTFGSSVEFSDPDYNGSIITGEQFVGESPSTMISLEYLTNFINDQVIKKITDQNNKEAPKIICDATSCMSNYYPYMISTLPTEILFYSGISDQETDLYRPTTEQKNNGINYPTMKAYPKISSPITIGFYEEVAGKGMVGMPSKIYISLSTIKNIIEKLEVAAEYQNTLPVKAFLAAVSGKIFTASAGAMHMKLIPNANFEDQLLFYDIKYLGTNLDLVQEFTIPVFSSKTWGTVVREFKIDCVLPQDYRAFVFGKTAFETNPNDSTLYSDFFYDFSGNDEDIKAEKKLQFQKENKTKIKRLLELRGLLAQSITNNNRQTNLYRALKSYIVHNADNLQDNNKVNRPQWPLSCTFTIDGINGFRFGDLLQFNGIPKRYKDKFSFCIQKVSHTVSQEGDWTTTITAFPRIVTKTISGVPRTIK